MSSAARLLVIDDEPDLRTLYELTLLREGHEVLSVEGVGQALDALKQHSFDLIITDMRLPDGSGLELLKWLEQAQRCEKAIVITAFGSAEGAVEALKAGAFDYLTKPVDLRQFRQTVGAALGRLTPMASASGATAALPAKTAAGASHASHTPGWGGKEQAPPGAHTSASPRGVARLVGGSAAMQAVRELIEKVARSMAPVLVHGESGTGKELVARALHEQGARAQQPFVAVNCGAIPEHLLEAEFFGFRKGAFTGANEDRDGFFQAAEGGTLFLDEIGDLPLAMQSKLLRVIQERSVRRVGATQETPTNVRILSATHKDLAAEVAAGRFRQDLFYRLNVIQIRVPPLRERMEDLLPLCHRVLARIAREAGVSPVPELTPAALQTLARYSFAGNVRELENLLHRALALAGSAHIDVPDLNLPAALLGEARAELPEAVHGAARLDATLAAEPTLPALPALVAPALPAELPTDLARYLDDVERAILLRALEAQRFNRTAAAASLGLSLRQIRYRMARLSIAPADALGDAASDSSSDASNEVSGRA